METTAKKQNLFQKLINGQLPDMNLETQVSLTQSSLIETAAILFVTVALIFLAWFTFKKLFS